VDADDESAEARKKAEFLESCMEDMNRPWEEMRAEIVGDFLTYGHVPAELVYKRRQGYSPNKIDMAALKGATLGGSVGEDLPAQSKTSSKFDDGKVGWRKIATRAPETIHEWIFDEAGGIQGLIQMAPPSYKYRVIPIEKMLLFRTTTARGNPEGLSILRGAFIPYTQKKQLRDIQMIGIERDLTGFPTVYGPENLELYDSSNQKAVTAYNKLKKWIRTVRTDKTAGGIFPYGYKFELVSSPGQKTTDVEAVIGGLNTEMLIAILMDFLITGHEKIGSYALNLSKVEIAVAVIGAYIDIFHEIFNQYAIPRLFRLNGDSMDKLPRLSCGKVLATDLAKLEKFGTILEKLAGVGWELFPDPELDAHLRELLGIPERSDVLPDLEELAQKQMERKLNPPTPPAPPPSPGEGGDGQGSPPPGGAKAPTEEPKAAGKPTPGESADEKPDDKKAKAATEISPKAEGPEGAGAHAQIGFNATDLVSLERLEKVPPVGQLELYDPTQPRGKDGKWSSGGGGGGQRGNAKTGPGRGVEDPLNRHAPSEAQDDWEASMSLAERRELEHWGGSVEACDRIRTKELTGGPKEGEFEESKRAYDDFHNAIDRAPAYEGVVYRGLDNMDGEFIGSLKKGDTWEFEATSSASKSSKVAKGYGTYETGPSGTVDVVLKIDARNGADLSRITGARDKEVVMRKGSKAKITGFSTMPLGKYGKLKVIEMEEIGG
jgi:hypothetical protein